MPAYTDRILLISNMVSAFTGSDSNDSYASLTSYKVSDHRAVTL